jgi:hypothetical protein
MSDPMSSQDKAIQRATSRPQATVELDAGAGEFRYGM